MIKNITIIFITVVLGLTSCKQKLASLNNQIIISGKITGFELDNKDIKLHINKIGYAEQIELSSNIDSNGNFKFCFDNELSQDILMGYKRNYLRFIIHPGDSIFIDLLKENDHVNINYSGDGAIDNQLLSNYLHGHESIVNGDSIYWYCKDLKPEQYKKYCKEIYQKLTAYQNDFFNSNKTSQELRTWIEMGIISEYVNWLLIYPNNNASMNNLSLSEVKIDADYYDFLETIPPIKNKYLINTEVAFFLPNYILGFYISRKVASEHNWQGFRNQHDSLMINEILQYEKKDSYLSQMMLNNFMNWKLIKLDTTLYVKYLPLINDHIKEPILRKPLTQLYNEAKIALQEKNISSNAKLIKWKGTDVSRLIDSIKSNGKNKIIYIDVWATWCGPCIAEMPASRNLQEKFKNEKVDFVYINVDSEQNLWKSFIAKFGLGGYHYFLDNKQSKALCQELKIVGIPHYLIIDKQGNYIKTGPDYRPDKSKKIIIDLLNK